MALDDLSKPGVAKEDVGQNEGGDAPSVEVPDTRLELGISGLLMNIPPHGELLVDPKTGDITPVEDM